MDGQYERSIILFGKSGMENLRRSRVAVFGIGGVGGHAAEALARSGIGTIHLIDSDTVSPSNLNRQAVALLSTVGRYKVDVMAERIADIDPGIKTVTHKVFFDAETEGEFDFSQFDYVIDAIDSVGSKVLLIKRASERSGGIISSMGAGNKLDPTRFEVADIYSTSVCPLARVMRTKLRHEGIERLKVVYSKEPPVSTGSGITGSTAFVPSAAGLIMAGEVVKALAFGKDREGKV